MSDQKRNETFNPTEQDVIECIIPNHGGEEGFTLKEIRERLVEKKSYEGDYELRQDQKILRHLQNLEDYNKVRSKSPMLNRDENTKWFLHEDYYDEDEE
jgi:hypothetical protein